MMVHKPPRTVVIDANSFIYRNIMVTAHDDLKVVERVQGVRTEGVADTKTIVTGGVYRTLTSLRALLALPGVNAGRIVAFFDCGVPEFRRELFEHYKEARKKNRKDRFTEEEEEQLFRQLDLARDLLELLGVVCSSFQDREADDAVAACVQAVVKKGGPRPIVVTGDKDLWQCVAMGADIWNLSKKEFIDTDNFEERTGFPLSLYLVAKALIGDPSDGIPGAAGCGQKRAKSLCEDYREELETYTTPRQKMRALVRLLEAKEGKLRKYEQNIVESARWLDDVIRGIDLKNSFGGLSVLNTILKRKPKVDLYGFLRFCKRLKFNSVLGDPEKFLKPFKRAEKLRG
jgi:5'-3' exonuclease